MTGGWFTLTELQERLNREHRQSLREALQNEEIPTSKLGTELLIREEAFLDWMKREERVKHPKSKGAA